MVDVTFDKDRALAMVRALARGEALNPSGQAWTRDELLMLAGACMFGLMARGPESLRGVDPAAIPLEHREHRMAQLADDLCLAFRWNAEATRFAVGGNYDSMFEPVHRVQVDGTQPTITPVTGVRESVVRGTPA